MPWLHRHLLPGYRLGYGLDSLASFYERICGLCIMRRTSPEVPLQLPALRKGDDSGRSSVLPLPPQALTPPSTHSGAKPPRAMAGAHVGARSWLHTSKVSAEPPLLTMNALAPDAMAAFMSAVIQDE